MKRDSVPRSIGRLVYCVGRWLVIVTFIGTGHALASVAQIDMKARHEPLQSQSMNIGSSCPACQLAPAFTPDPLGSSGYPEGVVSACSMRTQVEPRAVQKAISVNAIRPPVSLRIRYCRWLN